MAPEMAPLALTMGKAGRIAFKSVSRYSIFRLLDPGDIALRPFRVVRRGVDYGEGAES